MQRRGGRSSVGRASVWPAARRGLAWLALGVMVLGGAIGLFSSPSVGLGWVCGGVLTHWAAWGYDQRWRRLQGELFRRRAVPRWRLRLGGALVRWGGAVDPGCVLRWAGAGFTIEKGLGPVWRIETAEGLEGGGLRGCPLWYYERDYVLAHEQAEERS